MSTVKKSKILVQSSRFKKWLIGPCAHVWYLKRLEDCVKFTPALQFVKGSLLFGRQCHFCLPRQDGNAQRPASIEAADILNF